MVGTLVSDVAKEGSPLQATNVMKDFAADRNTRSQKFYRLINEVPTLLMIGIVIMVIVKPF